MPDKSLTQEDGMVGIILLNIPWNCNEIHSNSLFCINSGKGYENEVIYKDVLHGNLTDPKELR